MAVVLTPKQAAAGLRELGRRMGSWERKPYGPVMKLVFRNMFAAVEDVHRHVMHGTSIGRKVWGRESKWFAGVVRAVKLGGKAKASNLPSFVYPAAAKRGGGGVVITGIVAKGIPALYEKGGRTKPHMIRPNKARWVHQRKLLGRGVLQTGARRGSRVLVGEGVLKLGDRYVRWVKEHSARVPKKPYIEGALARREGMLAAGMGAALEREAAEVIGG